MMRGLVFDIKEFAVLDGPGIRTTVFLKGCPLRCVWCHNPEGFDGQPQVIRGQTGERTAGTWYSVDELSEVLIRQEDVLRAGEGGVTFSGGEPLSQAAFVGAVMDRLGGIHTVLDTSGYGDGAAFSALVERSDLVLFDLKLMDPREHLTYTGRDNAIILQNLERLDGLGCPTIVRVPLIPGVTDTESNVSAIAERASCLGNLVRVELLPYNRAAGGKYASCGMDFDPPFDQNSEVRSRLELFAEAGVTALLI